MRFVLSLVCLLTWNAFAGDAGVTGAAKTTAPIMESAAYNPTVLPTILSLGLVIGAILVTGFVLRRVSPGLRQAGTLLKPVAQIAVGPKEKVAVIQFQGELLVIGITANQVSLLTKGVADITKPIEGTVPTEKALLDRWLGRLKTNDPVDLQAGVNK
jgi:flagellar protein FliO/FliZ